MLYVECYPDELLARLLGVPRREIRHARGKGNILNRLRNLQAGQGMIDEDPWAPQPEELGQYIEQERSGDLTLRVHKKNPRKRLIVVSPRLEEWLYVRAAVCGVRPADYGLPDTGPELRKIPRFDKDQRFEQFVKKLAADSAMQWLRRCLVEFR
ncbi:hypothetical protein [Limisphaera sp. VF-2]|jgi:hypothetical protein|uniref:hypothetical protein n=1 Tax=Limisphaera sp. VF-2 TaxID=3400418 RepID=UPI0017648020